ncbi:hypothetical protein IV54_GL001933 [Levilactobacillus paucivorans]|uniref:Uncharacterized protein n=1 Tax=Levilactobacillus paucivorans TaxID=616990 RepID=A0A0R2M033_9LACO|nr:hypothetical protein [Levilactobacillus paucivorans]KRO03866.1 hypothetical protein IV54_GL001933 [Levilactobacillus paucivorans]
MNENVQEKIDKVACKFSGNPLISEDFLLSNDSMSYNVDVSENQGGIRLLNHKVLRGLLLFGAVVGMGLTSATLSAQASSKYVSLSNDWYVRTKKSMYLDIYQKHGKKYKPLLIKKGTLLVAIPSYKWHQDKVTAAFRFGAIHYSKLKNLRFPGDEDIPLTKANFKPVTLKAPIRSTILRPGIGFEKDKDSNFSTPAFYLTLDNYIQYYSKAAMDKYAPGGDIIVNTGNEDDAYKPTASAKMTKTTVKGTTTTVQYRTPIKGIPGKKIGAHKYQIKIKSLRTEGHYNDTDPNDFDRWSGYWNNYTVNGKPYFSGFMDGDGDE